MSTYKNICRDCGDITETKGWKPERCPFCELKNFKQQLAEAKTFLCKFKHWIENE